MKEERKKYIIVDAKNISITLRKKERVCGFNDFWNEYKAVGETTATEIFERYQIPKEFQKIAFALPTCRVCNSNGYEILTQRQFQIQKNTPDKEFVGHENGRWFDGDVISSSLRFKTPKQKEKYESIISFYEQLTNQGYLEQYVEAIKNIFFLENELRINGETKKVEEKAATLLKKHFIRHITNQ